MKSCMQTAVQKTASTILDHWLALLSLLFRNDLSVLNFVKSDFVMLKDRLAVDYDISGIDGIAIRRVHVEPDSARSGLVRRHLKVIRQPKTSSTEDIVGRSSMMYDLMHLAIQTDSTRMISMLMDQSGGNGAPPIEGVSEGRHGLGQHGMDEAKLAKLRLVEIADLKAFASFLNKLSGTNDASGESLLTNTMVLYGSDMGNSPSHDTRNLPIFLAGGGFKHSQHLAFNPSRSVPLSNLFANMLQRYGLDIDRFSSGTGTLIGLEFA